jgi:hypothetical protein
MFIPMTLKVTCFYRFTQVFILKKLIASIAALVSVANKKLRSLAEAKKQKRQQDAGATRIRQNDI